MSAPRRGVAPIYPERPERIRAMRAEGMTLKAICESLGVSKAVINRALYPRVRAYEKAYNRERYYIATCERCGTPCTHNVHSKESRGRLCAPCYWRRGEQP